jgi:hypothetical protein
MGWFAMAKKLGQADVVGEFPISFGYRVKHNQ